MKLALVTTTVTVPHTLRLLRAIGHAARFFIAGDKKSPHREIDDLCDELGHSTYLHPDEQAKWKCSELLGWNCIQRRNIATLEALRWGATHIYSWDTDNIPMDVAHFELMEDHFQNFNGPQISSSRGWFDPGLLLTPQVRQRGVPIEAPFMADNVSCAVGAKVGVVAGGCLGNPDTNAATRLTWSPEVVETCELMRSGVVIDPSTWTVFNSQNTAFVRELAPCMFMLPGVGRYDDIFASLITQRVMREHGYHVFHGKPFTWQQRHEHDLIADLKAEIYGMENVKKFADVLSPMKLLDGSPLEQMRCLVERSVLPFRAHGVAGLWLDDCEKAMTELPL